MPQAETWIPQGFLQWEVVLQKQWAGDIKYLLFIKVIFAYQDLVKLGNGKITKMKAIHKVA